jgi:hypothetical protein
MVARLSGGQGNHGAERRHASLGSPQIAKCLSQMSRHCRSSRRSTEHFAPLPPARPPPADQLRPLLSPGEWRRPCPVKVWFEADEFDNGRMSAWLAMAHMTRHSCTSKRSW